VNFTGRISSVALAATVGAAFLTPQPAAADGAASTRNIIFGAAAVGVGTWAVINHNAKVHQKEAEEQQAEAAAQAQADDAAAGSRHVSGSDTCKSGYVWRQAWPEDHVCVTTATRSQAQSDNAAAASRLEKLFS